MTKSIEQQADEYATQLEKNHYATETFHPASYYAGVDVGYEAGAKARDAQWLKVVNELREALKFYKNHADCNSGIIYGTCRCAFCKGDDKHRSSLTKADQMLKERNIEK